MCRRNLLDATFDAPPRNVNDANFDTNVAIILAALLCALICVLGVNLIVRCVLRCCRRIVLETSEEAAVRLASTGLKKKVLRGIPVTVYGSAMVTVAVVGTECAICLGEFTDGEKLRVLPKCNHGFHVRCIDTWLASHLSCPTCRCSLLDATDKLDATETQGESETVVEDEVS